MSSHLVLDAYLDAPGYQLALDDLLPRPHAGPGPALVIAGVLSACAPAEKATPSAPPITMSAAHQHDAAIGVALHVCVEGLRSNPALFASYGMVWHEIQVGRDFASLDVGAVGAACVPSAALLACQAEQTWTGIDTYFQANPGQTCVSVVRTVDRVRVAMREVK